LQSVINPGPDRPPPSHGNRHVSPRFHRRGPVSTPHTPVPRPAQAARCQTSTGRAVTLGFSASKAADRRFKFGVALELALPPLPGYRRWPVDDAASVARAGIKLIRDCLKAYKGNPFFEREDRWWTKESWAKEVASRMKLNPPPTSPETDPPTVN